MENSAGYFVALAMGGTILGLFLPLFWLFISREKPRGRVICCVLAGVALGGTTLGVVQTWTGLWVFLGLVVLLTTGTALAYAAPQPVERLARLEKFGAVVVVGLALADLGLWAIALDNYAGISRLTLFTVVICVIGAGVCLPLVLRTRSTVAGTLVALFMVAAVAQRIYDFTPVKPYQRFYEKISAGMTDAEVRTAMVSEFPPDGRYPQPVEYRQGDHLFYLLDPTDGDYNAESVGVVLRDGRVVQKWYHGD